MKKTILALLLCSFISACGGGGGGVEEPPLPPGTEISGSCGHTISVSGQAVTVDNLGACGDYKVDTEGAIGFAVEVTCTDDAHKLDFSNITYDADGAIASFNLTLDDMACSYSSGKEPLIDTTPPTITSVSPSDGVTKVTVGTSISLTFSEEMNKTSVENAFSLKYDNNVVDGTFSWSGNTATFKPSANLGSHITYTINLLSAATDLASNAMGSDFSASFTTAYTLGVAGTLITIHNLGLCKDYEFETCNPWCISGSTVNMTCYSGADSDSHTLVFSNVTYSNWAVASFDVTIDDVAYSYPNAP